MIEFIDEGTEAHTVAEKNELVLPLRALLPGARQILDRGGPFVMRELRLAREGVQVRDEGGDELERARVFGEALVQLLDAVRTVRQLRNALNVTGPGCGGRTGL